MVGGGGVTDILSFLLKIGFIISVAAFAFFVGYVYCYFLS